MFCSDGLGLHIVVARDVGLLEQKRNELPVWLGSFLFLRLHFKIRFAVLFKIAFSFSKRRIRVRVLNAERKISYCVQDDFTHFFQVFFSQGDNPKISLLQKVEERAPFACKKPV